WRHFWWAAGSSRRWRPAPLYDWQWSRNEVSTSWIREQELAALGQPPQLRCAGRPADQAAHVHGRGARCTRPLLGLLSGAGRCRAALVLRRGCSLSARAVMVCGVGALGAGVLVLVVASSRGVSPG